MKRIKKMFIIIALSLYLTAVITPEKEEKAEAAGITISLVLGALAIAGAGGVIAFNSSAVMQDVGNKAMDKLTEQGQNVSEMFAQNKFGINKNLTDALADSIQETTALFQHKTFNSLSLVIEPGETMSLTVPADLAIYNTNIEVLVNHIAPNEEALNNLYLEIPGAQTRHRVTNANWRTSAYSELLSTSFTQTRHRIRYLSTTNKGTFVLHNLKYDDSLPMRVSIEAFQYSSVYEKNMIKGLVNIPKVSSGTESLPINYREIINNNYQHMPAVASIDYEKLSNIVNGTSDEVVNLTNLETIVTNIEADIEEGFEEQKSLSMRILTKVQAIPGMIAEMGTTTLGGISSLTDDVITGLGNFTDRITQANDRLWEDAGAIWSGMGEALSNLGENVKTFGQSIVGSIENGIDNIRDTTADMAESIGHGIDKVWTGITDLGAKIGTIEDNIMTGLVNIVVPSEADMEKVGEKADRLRNTFFQKLDFITVPIKSISGLFLQPKSLYDVTFTMQGVEVHVLPESFRSSVNVLKPVLNGVLVLLTFFGIYKKIQGKEVI